MFGAVPQPRAHPYVGREDRIVYRAILILRFAGKPVYRFGADRHAVGGRPLPVDELIAEAKREQYTIKALAQNEARNDWTGTLWRSRLEAIKSI